jgi:hypothetical protein
MNADTQAIADAVTAKVLAAVNAVLAPVLEAVAGAQPLMTQEQLAKSMNISVSQVKRYRADGMPVIRLSARCPRFRWSECVAWRTARNKPAKKPVAGVVRRISR